MDAVNLIDQRYEPTSLIKRGAASAVYLAKDLLAKDLQAEHRVIVKLLNRPSRDGQHRLRREFRVMSRLNHPNVVKTLGMGVHEAQPYLVMEYLSGGTLQAHCPGSPESTLKLRERLKLLAEVTDALAYIHAQGIIHRNLKPENVMLEGGQAKLMDFGLLKSDTDATLALTREGDLLGTAAYMSPEQIRGGKLDTRSDLYAFGCLLYWALAGEPPFTGDSSAEILVKHRHHPPQPPSSFNPLVPEEADRVVLKLLEKVPDERYSTAAAVGAELRQLARLLQGEAPAAARAEDVALPPDSFTPTQLFSAPLVGKEALWQRLSKALHQPNEGGRFFVVRAEPGLGLSRVLEELRREARLLEQLALKLDMSQSANAPYLAWRECLRLLQEALPEDFAKAATGLEAALAPLLPKRHADPAAFPAEVMQLRLYDAVDTLLTRLSERAPVLLLADDLHAADEGSLGLLAYLARSNLGKRAVMVAGVHRDLMSPALRETLRDLADETLELEPLPESSVRRLIEALLAAEVDAQLVKHVTERAAGNPFFVEEILLALLESGHITRRLGMWEWSREAVLIPQSVEDVFTRRFQGLPERSQRVLEVASTMGHTFSFDLLLDLLEIDEDTLLDDIEDLLRGNFITELPGDHYAFTHPLLLELLHERLEPLERRRLHLQLAQLFGQDAATPPEVLAEHYAETDTPALAAPYALQVAQQAQEVYANDVAERYYRLALKVLPQDDARIGEIRLRLGSVLECIGRWQEAHDLYTQALEQPNLRARALYHLGALSHWQSNFQESEAYLRQAQTLEPEHAATYGFLGRTLIMKGDTTAAEEILRQGLQVALDTEEKQENAIVDAYLNLVNLEFNCSRWDKALSWLEQAKALTSSEDKLTTGRLLHWLAILHHVQQNLTEARKFYEQARDTFLAVGDIGKLLIVLQNLALMHAETGNRRQALQIYEDVKLRARRLGDKNERARATANQGEALLKLGHYAEARQALEEARRIFQELGITQSEAYVRLGLISVMAQQGKLEEAQEEVEIVQAILERSPHGNHDALLHLRQGELALYGGNPMQARRLLTGAAGSFLEMDDKHTLLEAQLLLAKTNIILANRDDAKHNLEQAKRLARVYRDAVLNVQIAYLEALNAGKPEEISYLKDELEALSQHHFVALLDNLIVAYGRRGL